VGLIETENVLFRIQQSNVFQFSEMWGSKFAISQRFCHW